MLNLKYQVRGSRFSTYEKEGMKQDEEIAQQTHHGGGFVSCIVLDRFPLHDDSAGCGNPVRGCAEWCMVYSRCHLCG